MAVRRERVILDLEDLYTGKIARATAATSLLRKEIDRVDGKRISRELTDSAKSVDKTGEAFRKASPDIDKFSGRLGLLAEAAVIGAPALVRLGAGAIPVLTGALAGLGAAAGGLGVTILAFHGLGDALKALNTYQLEPTAQNLQALRLEQEKLGPSGAQFLHYLDQLEPVLKDLQNTARAGIFPGAEEGIDALLSRLPQVRTVISELSKGIGDIASGAGQSLGGGDFDAFFSYLETDARPTLEAFAKSAGNVALGVSNLIVAFAPLNRGFTGGLEDATKAFADWSKGLDDNQSFQDFVSYIRESGPELVQFAGAVAQAFTGIIEAAAPVGRSVLPILTGIAKVFGLIASSPIGPAVYGSVAAFLAFNRAASVASKISDSVSGSLDKLTGNAEKAQGGLSRLATIGAASFAGLTVIDSIQVGAAKALPGVNSLTGSLLDLIAAAQGGATGELPKQFDDLSASIERLADPNKAQQLQDTISDAFGGVGGGSQLKNARAEVESLDAALTNLVNTGGADQAKLAFDAITQSAGLSGQQVKDLSALLPGYADALAGVANQSTLTASSSGFLEATISNLAHGAFAQATDAAEQFSGALAHLNGWFDKRDAVRGYLDSIDTFTKGLHNGFTREDSANIDAVGRGIIQVAQSIKNPQLRDNFLQQARAQLEEMAKTSGPRAAAAIQEIINKFDDKGLTHPTPTELSVDDRRAQTTLKKNKNDLTVLGKTTATPTVDADAAPAVRAFNQIGSQLTGLSQFTATPRVTVNVSQAQAAINNVRNLLGGVHDKSVSLTITTNHVGGVTSSAGGRSVPVTGSAEGSHVPSLAPSAGPYLLADLVMDSEKDEELTAA